MVGCSKSNLYFRNQRRKFSFSSRITGSYGAEPYTDTPSETSVASALHSSDSHVSILKTRRDASTDDPWMPNSSRYEDVLDDPGIPTMITWSHGGKEVFVEGSLDNWKTK
ncbi:unnamed protein product [Musa acuminata subsp. malaccensis]|uniref:(wild Malaysian banana) hypothetical protein n=1 Tax=Musa acuminata subsp. malaccensis TaxID=214687 RepID=A0A804HN15_MUSAM|nr:unnamed protein product [Musa acuminata subsp. malaccensis]